MLGLPGLLQLDRVVAGAVGAVVTFLLKALWDWWRNRPNLRITVPAEKSWTYYAERSSDGTWSYSDPKTNSESRLFVECPVYADNRSGTHDSVVGMALRLTRAQQPSPAFAEGSEFLARVVEGHHLEVILVKFHFDRDSYGDTPEWSSPNKRPLPLSLTTGRGRHIQIDVTTSPQIVQTGTPVTSPYVA